MRYKLIPSRPGTGKRRLKSRYVEGALVDARLAASAWYTGTQVPILICEVVESGLVNVVEMMPREAAVKVRQAPRSRTTGK